MNSNRSIKQRRHRQHARTDLRTRDVVEQAIAALPSLGLQQAAEFLAAMKVSPDVAIRTLVYPRKRRH